jgi:Domain of unknown function (DUF4132)
MNPLRTLVDYIGQTLNGRPVTPERRQAIALLDAYWDETQGAGWNLKPADFASGKMILESSPRVQIAVVLEMLEGEYRRPSIVLQQQLLHRPLPFTAADMHVLLTYIAERRNAHGYEKTQVLLKNAATALSNPALLEACKADLGRIRETAKSWKDTSGKHKFLMMLDQIQHHGQRTPLEIADDEWGRQARVALKKLRPDERAAWEMVLRHAMTSGGSGPSQKWLKAASGVIENLGTERFAVLTLEWLSFLGKTGSEMRYGYDHEHQRAYFEERGPIPLEVNAVLLAGLAWSCAALENTTLERTGLIGALGDAALECYRKIPSFGQRSTKVGNACLTALKLIPGMASVSQMERLRASIKLPSTRKLIEKALNESALNAGMSRFDLEELATPGFGLQDGRVRVLFGDAFALLTVDGMRVNLHWFGADGKPRKSQPSEVKRDFGAERKALKRQREDLEKILSTVRDRLERAPALERAWSLQVWRERYLDHPLASQLAKRLIWRFTDGDRVQDGMWLEGRLVDANDVLLEVSEQMMVKPWHPVFCAANEVLAWRAFLDRHQIVQPFKQAHRELYILTDAERTTHTYSNRFAAHVLRQHQFRKLCEARGWQYSLQGQWDSHNFPTLEIPHAGLIAEFWVDAGAGETSDSGIYLYVSTDQVRFTRADFTRRDPYSGWPKDPEPMPLSDVPPIIFSEVMRDVDLFVGVASVGNDPTWNDGGPDGTYRDYWQSYSFGELSETAQTRKAVLKTLVPRLKIKDRVHLEGKFLHVRGDVRTYKIHLGSGNILMLPNDQYLCIVPGRAALGRGNSDSSSVFLPFEGDGTLAVILSKAFMLAEDTKIKDETITRQIKP